MLNFFKYQQCLLVQILSLDNESGEYTIIVNQNCIVVGISSEMYFLSFFDDQVISHFHKCLLLENENVASLSG